MLDTPAEAPLNSRRLPPRDSHRLRPLVRHSNRHSSMFGNRSAPSLSPSLTMRTARPPHAAAELYFPPAAPGYHLQDNQNEPYQSRAQGRPTRIEPPPFIYAPHSQNNRDLPDHPFQLGNTLNDVHYRATNPRRTYNQRTHYNRSNPTLRNVSGASSQSSANGGGVNVRSSGSSGNSTVGPSTASRRKRLLSISSDDSVNAQYRGRRHYDY